MLVHFGVDLGGCNGVNSDQHGVNHLYRRRRTRTATAPEKTLAHLSKLQQQFVSGDLNASVLHMSVSKVPRLAQRIFRSFEGFVHAACDDSHRAGMVARLAAHYRCIEV
eukprot:SAG11_NODE_1529_length_4738_cov_1.628799_2_plen_109_part_00